MITSHPHRPRRFARRILIGLALAGVAGVGSMPTARAEEIALGRFGFGVPATIHTRRPPRAGWQWEGQQTEGGVPSIIVLARADVFSSDPHEVLGLLLASAAGGWLPELTAGPTLASTTQDGSPALRQPISYRPAAKINYSGTVLITSNRGTSAVLAVIGTSRLTAGRTDEILDSAGWST